MKNVVRILICILLVCVSFAGGNLTLAGDDYPVSPSPPFQMITSHNIHSDYSSKFAPVPYRSGFVFGNANGRLQYMVGGNIWMDVLIDETDIISSPIIVDSYAIVGTKVGTIAKVNIESGDIVWKKRVRNAIIGKPVYDDGRIYVGSADESFYCLDFDDGSIVFEYRTKTPIWSTPCIFAERVIFGGDDDKIYCLNKYSGNVIWEISCDGLLEAEPILDGFYLYVGSLNGFVYKVNAITGEIIWNTAVPGVIHSKGVFVKNFLAVADDSGTVSFIDKKDGRIITQNSSFAPISAPLTTNSETVYFVDRNKDFIGIDIDGVVIWKRRLINSVRSELLILDQKIYMLTSDGYLQLWEECGYVSILPENKNLGDFYSSDGYQSFDIEIVIGRDDGRVKPGAVIGRPFEAGKRCKAVLFRNTDVY
ncbi:MAG: PQQ-binding-like beta-propeller repeat protein, partial [Caldisericia bacterium]